MNDNQPDTETYLESMTPNWDHSIAVQSEFNADLLNNLTLQILRLRNKNPKTISVALDSYGGDIQILEALVSLLRTKPSNGDNGRYLCVVTNCAFSAAAVLLTWADYSIAYPHSSILFHDTRFPNMTNVTPSKALQTARDLRGENDRLALILAKTVARRLVWVYIDKHREFSNVRTKYAQLVTKYEPAIEDVCPKHPDNEIDVLGFALTILDGLDSESAKQLVYRALNRLTEWISIERIERALTNYESSEGGTSLVSSINKIYEAIGPVRDASADTATGPNQISDALKRELMLFLEIVLKSAKADPDWTISLSGFEKIQYDFELIRELRSNSHARDIIRMMLNSDYTFLGTAADKLEKVTELDQRRKILAPFFPQARLFWYFTVLLCKTMFEGENMISARDAQLLGVVDEVWGGGPVESRREFHIKDEKEQATPAQ